MDKAFNLDYIVLTSQSWVIHIEKHLRSEGRKIEIYVEPARKKECTLSGT